MDLTIDLDGRTCLVVGGAGGGIGTAVADGALAAGGRLAVVTNLREHANDAVARAEAAGATCVAVVADATDEAALVDAIADVAATVGPIRHVVNVVGGNSDDDYHRAAEYDMATFDRVVARNLRYAVVTCREIARPLLDAGLDGSIVNISSGASRGTPLLGAYAAAKSGLEAFSRTMALEWGPRGIRVNVVSLGSVRTPRTGADDRAEAAAAIPLRRRGDAEEVAGAVLFLLSDLASYTTGHTLVVDGGVGLGHPGGAGLSALVDRPAVRERLGE
jgi:NAD(P)-dependent dehydrogenase (short-subunit alcohol dehydrogenase family)